MSLSPLIVRLTLVASFVALGGAQTTSAQFVRSDWQKKVASKPRPAARKRAGAAEQKKAPKSQKKRVVDSLESRLALQLALEGANFSPGIIDGLVGPKTRGALAAFQALHAIEQTGELDDDSRKLLRFETLQPTRQYTLTKSDAKRVGPCPTEWLERSRADRMPFRSLLEVVAFEGHCTHRLIKKLNPKVDIQALQVGQTIVLPNVVIPYRNPSIVSIEIDFARKQLRGMNAAGHVAALFHCSIARQAVDRPQGECSVASIAIDPQYTFRPESWPEVKGIDRVLQIPPGPRNPVGLCWIDLSISGYGIHGTPEPELIGKTGSHGCFRLTNWDVLRLAKMVKPGMNVALIQGEQQVAALNAE